MSNTIRIPCKANEFIGMMSIWGALFFDQKRYSRRFQITLDAIW